MLRKYELVEETLHPNMFQSFYIPPWQEVPSKSHRPLALSFFHLRLRGMAQLARALRATPEADVLLLGLFEHLKKGPGLEGPGKMLGVFRTKEKNRSGPKPLAAFNEGQADLLKSKKFLGGYSRHNEPN